jgi:hypothetical protein
MVFKTCQQCSGCNHRPTHSFSHQQRPLARRDQETYVHIVEALIDLCERAMMRDVFVDLEVALEVI